MLATMLQGYLLGLAYVAPIGTQNIFVINTALTQSRRRILLTALIVTFFDVSLSVACFLGVGALISASVWLELGMLLAGGAVVLWMGWGLVRARGKVEFGEAVELPLTRVIATSCVVTWFNPQAIIDGSLLLGASRAAVPAEYGTAFILSCAMASVTWWFGMSLLVNHFRTRFSDRVLRGISLICGLFLLFYGGKLLWNGITLIPQLS